MFKRISVTRPFLVSLDKNSYFRLFPKKVEYPINSSVFSIYFDQVLLHIILTPHFYLY